MARNNRYIAFLRGINVGGHRVKMEDLRRVFEESGLSNVSTFLASGNVIFEAAPKSVNEPRIEAALRAALGYDVPTLVRTPDELKEIIGYRPFSSEALDNPDFRLHVCFLRQTLDKGQIESLRAFETPMDVLKAHGREVYWLCRGPLNQSLAKWPKIEKTVTGVSTARNITMLRRLVDTLGESPKGR